MSSYSISLYIWRVDNLIHLRKIIYKTKKKKGPSLIFMASPRDMWYKRVQLSESGVLIHGWRKKNIGNTGVQRRNLSKGKTAYLLSYKPMESWTELGRKPYWEEDVNFCLSKQQWDLEYYIYMLHARLQQDTILRYLIYLFFLNLIIILTTWTLVYMNYMMSWIASYWDIVYLSLWFKISIFET